MSDDRLTAMEEALAHQTATVEDLSEVVHRQAAQIDRLDRRVALLMHRAAQAEAGETQGSIPLADPKPPHY